LKPSHAAFVAAPIRFIRHKQHAVLQMTVELADHFFSAGNLKRMRAEYPLQASNQSPLASAFWSDQH
jgi:hypothetical protein